jgi:hypothetical protein
MQSTYYIRLDVHKWIISYCVKNGSGTIYAEGTIPATRFDLDHWMKTLPQPWTAAMEATRFTGWIYDHLKPHTAAVKAARPLMLRASAAAKKKNNRIDARKICDCLRCDFLPECYLASTTMRALSRFAELAEHFALDRITLGNTILYLGRLRGGMDVGSIRLECGVERVRRRCGV